MTKETIISDCMLCVWDCGIKAHLEDGRLVKVEGLPEHPVSEGYICKRGEALPDYAYSPTRLKNPMMKKDGKWHNVSWDEALDFCAEKLTAIKDKYGPEALAVFCGSVGVENIELATFAKRFTNAFGSPNLLSVENICYRTRILARQTVFGRYPLDDPKESKCIVLWGHNPDGAKGMIGDLIRKKLEESGFQLIVIDPREIPLSENAFNLRIRPGTDAALGLAMLNVIINEDLYDKEFVEKYAIGFEELVKHVEEYTPEWAEGVTTIPTADIKTAARIFARTSPACIIQGVNTLDQHRNGFQNSRLLSILMTVTGNINVPGGWVTIPRIPLGNMNINVEQEALGSDEFPVFCKLWGRKAAFGIATMFPQAVMEGKPYPIKASVVAAANPVVSFPASHLYKEAFENLDFLAVIDPFMSETAELADVVLPACTFLEKGGISYVYGVVFGEPYAMIHKKVIEPLGDSWPDWKIWTEIARRMGMEDQFPWNSDDEVVDALLEPGEFADKIKSNPLGAYYGEKQYNFQEKNKLKTPSGKIEIYSQSLKDYGFDPIPVYMEPALSPVSTPELLKEYPLMLTSGARCQEYSHTMLRDIPVLRNDNPEPLAQIHPATAEKYGLKDYDLARIVTRNGSIKLRVHTSEGIIPDLVSVPHGWSQANVNILVDMDNIDPITAYPDFKTVLCRIEPVA